MCKIEFYFCGSKLSIRCEKSLAIKMLTPVTGQNRATELFAVLNNLVVLEDDLHPGEERLKKK